MESLKTKIALEGRVLPGNILKVDNFLNHQVDVNFLRSVGDEFKKLFQDKEITKVLTAEVSGIAIGTVTAESLGVPMLFAKKYAGSNMDTDTYEAKVHSYTKNNDYLLRVSKRYLNKEDKVLIVDDFLANGCALAGLIELCLQSGATIVGCGVVIEKEFQGGREYLKKYNFPIESLAIVESMGDGKINFKA